MRFTLLRRTKWEPPQPVIPETQPCEWDKQRITLEYKDESIVFSLPMDPTFLGLLDYEVRVMWESLLVVTPKYRIVSSTSSPLSYTHRKYCISLTYLSSGPSRRLISQVSPSVREVRYECDFSEGTLTDTTTYGDRECGMMSCSDSASHVFDVNRLEYHYVPSPVEHIPRCTVADWKWIPLGRDFKLRI
jgi:hypothetical protein